MFHGQQVVARGDARTTHVHHVLWRVAAKQSLEFLTQLSGLFETAIQAKIFREGATECARHVTTHGIDGLHFAAIAWRSARINEYALGVVA